MKIVILLAVLGCTAAAIHPAVNEELNEDWEAYKTTHDKGYDGAEDVVRRGIWEKNLKKIQHHNIRASLGEHTYTLGMNKFGDMTSTEFAETTHGLLQMRPSTEKKGSVFMYPLNTEVPASVDWRTKGYVTPVQDQGQGCGSCWAFSAAGSLEGQIFRKTGKLTCLSAQNLVDCSQAQGNEGCNGGMMDQAFTYIQQVGIETERDYPYTGEDDNCAYMPSKKAAEDTGFVDIASGNETALIAAIATVGPISVAIDSEHDSFQFYSSGVYNEPACSSTRLCSALLAVGYGTDPKGGDYYIVKNSYGTSWGMAGYIWMSRGKNQCGIATMASYPTV